jgi:TDG/mug DNA glycosylase family protein
MPTDPAAAYPFETLPDYLAPGMRLLLVGINPSVYSVRQGRYFARKTSRFWPAFSRSRLSAEVRSTFGRNELGPEDDARLLELGIGFTDVVKVPSSNAAQVTPALFAEWAPILRQRIEQIEPCVAAFQGVTAYRAFERYALGEPKSVAGLGVQTAATPMSAPPTRSTGTTASPTSSLWRNAPTDQVPRICSGAPVRK